jgi:Tfp pilus assembly protein PilO
LISSQACLSTYQGAPTTKYSQGCLAFLSHSVWRVVRTHQSTTKEILMSDKKVVSLSAALKKKQDKEKELEMYRRHLSVIEDRMAFLEMDRKVTTEIIEMIENDTVVVVDDSLPIIRIDDDDYDLDE